MFIESLLQIVTISFTGYVNAPIQDNVVESIVYHTEDYANDVVATLYNIESNAFVWNSIYDTSFDGSLVLPFSNASFAGYDLDTAYDFIGLSLVVKDSNGVVTTYDNYVIWEINKVTNTSYVDGTISHYGGYHSIYDLSISITPFVDFVYTDELDFSIVFGKTLDCSTAYDSSLSPNFRYYSPAFGNIYSGFYFGVNLSLTPPVPDGGYAEGFNTGYNSGRQDGYDVGYDVGLNDNSHYTDWYNSGYTAGSSAGYAHGYQVGISESGTFNFGSILKSIVDTPIYFMQSLFGWSLFGQGDTLFTIILTLLTATLVVALLKKVF